MGTGTVLSYDLVFHVRCTRASQIILQLLRLTVKSVDNFPHRSVFMFLQCLTAYHLHILQMISILQMINGYLIIILIICTTVVTCH